MCVSVCFTHPGELDFKTPVCRIVSYCTMYFV